MFLIIRLTILTILAIFFTFFLTLQFLSLKIASIILCFPSQFQKQTHKKLQYFTKKLCLLNLIKMILDSSISLSFAFFINNYHRILLNGLNDATQKIHSLFLGQIIDWNWDSSNQIKEQIVQFLIWIYLILGYFGLTLQIALTFDLLYLFNLPTIAIYKFLSFLYSSTIILLKYLLVRISPNQKKWITTKISFIHQYHSIQALSIVLIFLLVYSVFFISFYYCWLALVIVIFKSCLSVVINFEILIDHLGQYLFAFKNSKNLINECCYILNSMKSKFVSVVNLMTISQIIQGIDLLKNQKVFSQRQDFQNCQKTEQGFFRMVSNIYSVLVKRQLQKDIKSQ